MEATITLDEREGFTVKVESEGERSPRAVAFLAYLALDLASGSLSDDPEIDFDASNFTGEAAEAPRNGKSSSEVQADSRRPGTS